MDDHPTLQPPHLKHRFDTLDALRGIAAIVVVLFHDLGKAAVPHGYMAVDFFFLLSGFVVTYAYQAQLDGGWRSRDFLLTRFVRLYPLYLTGLLLGLFTMLVLRFLHSVHLSGTGLGVVIIFGLLVLPVPSGLALPGTQAFPLNLPAWSLFCEAVANVYHALFLRRRGMAVLVGLTVAFGAALLYTVFKTKTLDFGADRRNAYLGLLRVGFSYTYGMTLFRLWRMGRFEKLRAPSILSILLLTCLLVGAPRSAFMWDLMCVVCFFPLLLLLSANAHVPALIEKPLKILADASYAVYVLHVPVLGLVARLWARSTGTHTKAPIWEETVALLATIVLGVVADRKLDNPLRRRIRGQLRKSTVERTRSSVA